MGKACRGSTLIAADQPKIFEGNIIAALSSADDGNMSYLTGVQGNTLENREKFLENAGIDSHHTTFMQVRYSEAEHFTRYKIVDETHKKMGLESAESSLVGDAVIVTEPRHAIFLPLADCAGAIIYDTKRKILMVSHLGRHSTEEQGGTKSIEYLKEKFQSNPDDMLVWMSPAVGKETYPLHKFGGQALQEVLLGQLLEAGVPRKNIEICSENTATNPNYFSHSQHLLGNGASNDRFAIAAMMTD
jgi:copper oxidase (laccase) domain-containing protein